MDPVMDRDEAVASPQAWNLYAYCHNNPVTLVDADGKSPFIPIMNLLTRIAAHPATQRALTWASTQGMRAWNAATRLFNTPQGQEAIRTGAELLTGAELGPPSAIGGAILGEARAILPSREYRDSSIRTSSRQVSYCESG